MSILRRLSTARLIFLLTALAASGVAAGAIAVAASGGGGATPAAKPLAEAVHDAATAPEPAGITGRVQFVNHLFPSGDMLGQVAPALVSGASGRIWLTNDGRGRIELQSNAGDTQVVWSPAAVSIYDASSNTVYRYEHAAAQPAKPDAGTPPTLADIATWIDKLKTHANVTDPQPDNVAGQPAYSVSVSPKANGGLFGEAQLAWAAAHGVPLRVAITAKGDPSPVVELKVTEISFAAVPSGAVDVAPPAGAKVVDLGSKTTGDKQDAGAPDAPVAGVDAVRAAVDFPLVAPATIGGRALSSARLVGKGALLTYGDGLGALLVHERKADAAASTPSMLGALPKVSLGDVTAHVLETPLGSALTFDRGGVSFVVGGSMTRADVEAAAKSFAA